MRNRALIFGITAFVSGASVMIFEIAASRAIAPYLGNSLVTWTALIGVVLLSLSIGNWLGGKLADRSQSAGTLATILISAAIVLALTNLAKSTFLTPLGMWDLDIRIRTVTAAILLLTPTSILLGMVNPYATRCLLTDLKAGGRTIGLFSALGNLGSILGTFLAGFLLLPSFGTSSVLTIISIVLAALAAVLAVSTLRLFAGLAVLVLLGTIPANFRYRTLQAQAGFIDTDTAYARIWIKEVDFLGIPILSFQLNRQFSSGKFLHSDELVFEYNRAFRIADLFLPEQPRALLLGGAGYTYPPDHLKRHPQGQIDIVEIDPGVTKAAKQHFGFVDSPQYKIIHADGRIYLNESEEQYNAIYLDAFGDIFGIPFQLITKEAVQAVEKNLVEDGIVVANIIAPPKSELLADISATFLAVFPHVELIPTLPSSPNALQNVVLLARRTPLIPLAAPRNPEEATFLASLTKPSDNGAMFTDDFAPVERYTSRLLIENY